MDTGRLLRAVPSLLAVGAIALLGASVTTVALHAGDTATLPGAHGTHTGHASRSVTERSVTELTGPRDGEPDVRFALTARHAAVTLDSGAVVDALTFDGTAPGPELRMRAGQLVEVVLRNSDVDEGVTLHWHGLDVPNAEDGVAGVTQDAMPPGGEHVYRFRPEQVGTFWYHSHQDSACTVHRGLFGALIVEPPGGGPDAVLLGHTLARTRADGHAEVLGPTPLRDTLLRIPAGGRIDVEFTAPATVALFDGRRSGSAPSRRRRGRPVRCSTRSATALPPRRSRAVRPRPGAGARHRARHPTRRAHRRLDDQRRAAPRPRDGSRGRAGPRHDPQRRHRRPSDAPARPSRPRALPRRRAPTGSPWWTDSLGIEPGETYEVTFRATNPGIWMDHCHNLTHAAAGMVMHLAYEGVTTPFHHSPGAGNTPE